MNGLHSPALAVPLLAFQDFWLGDIPEPPEPPDTPINSAGLHYALAPERRVFEVAAEGRTFHVTSEKRTWRT